MTEEFEKFDVMNRFNGEIAFTADIKCEPDTGRPWKLRLAVVWALTHGTPLTSLNLDGVDFSGYTCPIGSSFDGSCFDDSRFMDSSFDGSSFNDSSFKGSSFDGSRFVRSSFDGSRFVRSRFIGSRFIDSSFDGSRFIDSSFDGSSFNDSSFKGSRFVRSRFIDSSFDGSRFDGAGQAKADFYKILKESHLEIPGLITALKEGRISGSVYEGPCACLVGTIANLRGVSVDTLIKNSSRPAEKWFMMISEGDVPGDNSPGAIAAACAVEWAESYLLKIATSEA